MNNNPILNNPYTEPLLHYQTDFEGRLDYDKVCQGRRIFKDDMSAMPKRQSGQKTLYEWNENAAEYETHLINLCRTEVARWRERGYPHTTNVTKDLLTFWFNNPERLVTHKLFFAQQEAIETAIWLNEVAQQSNAGQHIINLLEKGQSSVSDNTTNHLPRIAFKMATGSGKTVVMAALICYHFFNRKTYPADIRFADHFLIIAPGITVKGRLGVLLIDLEKDDPQNYYHKRYLVPKQYYSLLGSLNTHLTITNYHSFEPKALTGNKRSPFDGKTDIHGNKIQTDNKETTTAIINRVLGKNKTNKRLVIFNDEAHHCYLPKSKSKAAGEIDKNENERAAMWFSGIRDIAKYFKLLAVYDLSATPYYLTGSGYTPYSLFPWVVSDFGLIEAIESGLVKIPFLPESDDTQKIEEAVLRNLYEHSKKDLPKEGQKTAQKNKSITVNEHPQIPHLVKTALDQFYKHYEDYDNGMRTHSAASANLYTAPPVFIVVCNNTMVSKEMYKYIAGFEYENDNKKRIVIQGKKDIFNNYDSNDRPKKRPPTLLIDSYELENSNQINDDFKKIFAAEIEVFKKEYISIYGAGSANKITDADILREVVNTVGQQGKLGAHIRCVVSVSMLTEGWDANTVTHIMGLRAFGSQLLCEQVAGRALRRMSYILKTYRKDTGEEVTAKDRHRFKPDSLIEKYPPEYAHIIGIPFKLFKGGASEPPSPPDNITRIKAMPEREHDMEIRFPNVVGYRKTVNDEPLVYDFSSIEQHVIDGSLLPMETVMASPISPNEEKIKVQSVFEKREQEIIYHLTHQLLNIQFTDTDQKPKFQLFNQLKNIVTVWYRTKIKVLNIPSTPDRDPLKLVYFEQPAEVAAHIARGINPHLNTTEYIRPVFNHYNPFGSTKYVNGNTIKEVYPTQKSHVNYVVMDSDWEAIAAKTLEELDAVQTYTKNQFLGLAIPYIDATGKERLYYPDFIAVVHTQQNEKVHLIIEITGMNKDKAEKIWYVENYWLPAVNAVRETHQYPRYAFIEIANDIRDIKNQLVNQINAL